MYTLTLTRDERRAFDWVGDRYNAGRVAELLIGCITEGQPEWDEDGDITFAIPEHVAWEIQDLAEEEDHSWPCFSAELANRLNALCWSIV
jgi:hypothetical protein